MPKKNRNPRMSLLGKTLAYAVLALLPAALTGCLEEEAGTAVVLPPGDPISSLKSPKSAALVGKTLYVASTDPKAVGIFAIDIDKDEVKGFTALSLPPNEVVAVGDSVLAIAETDHSTGALSTLNVKTGALSKSYRAVDSDNALSSDGAGKTFLMQRGIGTVTGFTGGRLESANVFLDVNVGTSSNPYDLALYGGKAFVVRYGKPSVLVLDAGKVDGGIRDSIDLSGYRPDSLRDSAWAMPGMAGAVLYGKTLFVTVQRLTNWVAKDTSKVILLDAATLKITGSIPLLRKNPISVASRGKYLYVSCVESYGTFTGAVERIDMEKGEHAGLVAEEATLNTPGDLMQFIPVSDTKGYLISSPVYTTSTLTAVDLR